MRRFLLAAAALGGLTAVTTAGAVAATHPLAPKAFVAQQTEARLPVVQADYYWHRHHWHHRRWGHDHWRYYN